MIKLITDSAADIGRAEAALLGIVVLPMLITIGNEEYRDGVAFFEK